MNKSIVYEVIEKALLAVSGQSNLPDSEIPSICILVSTVANSDDETRAIFYREIYKVAILIEKHLAEKRKELESQMGSIYIGENEVPDDDKKKDN